MSLEVYTDTHHWGVLRTTYDPNVLSSSLLSYNMLILLPLFLISWMYKIQCCLLVETSLLATAQEVRCKQAPHHGDGSVSLDTI